MSDKIFNIELSCGCLITEDTGTLKKPDGNAGMMPCLSDNCKCQEEYFEKKQEIAKVKE